MPPKKDERVDAYIAKAPEFAQPILARVRAAFHKGCPDLQETIKWGAPHFTRNGILGSMMAFKKHVSFGFWRGEEIGDPEGILAKVGNTLMAAAKVGAVGELPSQTVLAGYVKRAARLDAEVGAGTRAKKPASRKAPGGKRPPPRTPKDLAAALKLKKNAKAKQTFDAFPPSHKREYIEWITGAKKAETRERRLAQALEMLAAGKSKNWKYRSARDAASAAPARSRPAAKKKKKKR